MSFIEKVLSEEQDIIRREAYATVEMLEEFKEECNTMVEFALKTDRYIAYAVSYDDEGVLDVSRHTARTLKIITGLAGEVGGLYNHTFKWNKLDCPIQGVEWAYVDNLKMPLVAMAVLKYNISLGELKGPNNEEAD